ncbi:hypothetical protein CONLIGDRAFT_640875 [Coniochaeta ligniaria NRRL 30616]|uniref:Uncharacterized protein n=1 Tax=Coniochaeta ligniaria NRRL 30616 TaxID=1408157 RepID=A0A1J7JK81_9PEZI|nr:hypothetical protein CONLIGDRAFT_640875 [Coniochaeta ligniaria NRRL 30616]
MSPRSFLVSRQNQRQPSTTTVSVPSPSPSPPLRRKDDSQAAPISSSRISTAIMPAVKRKAKESHSSPSPSPPKTTVTLTRPTTPTSPVRIPVPPKSRETAHPQKQHRHQGERRRKADTRPKDVHSPDAIPASVAALLAVTSIPPPRNSRSNRQRRAIAEKRMTVESVIEQSQEVEEEFSLNLGKSPLDLLLSAPEDLDIDNVSLGDSNVGSPFSRTASLDSVPSLVDSYTTNTLSSIETPSTPFSSPKSRKSQPTRKSLEPVSSPPGEVEAHPLSSPRIGVEDLDFRVFDESPTQDKKSEIRLPYRPLKSAFKSNLTASLRALRQAARSFSTLNFSSIPPEDFLTRSILTIDPQVPYTDERRPQLEEEPTAELRRYLNPTSSSRLEQPSAVPSPVTSRGYTASIQMQTYKVQRQKSGGPPAGRIKRPSLGASGTNGDSVLNASEKSLASLEIPLPGPRQREMRENSDFIRIAVMEMAMRKRGKLDDQRPGRARWALPPRKTSAKPYEIGEDGVPARWVAATY